MGIILKGAEMKLLRKLRCLVVLLAGLTTISSTQLVNATVYDFTYTGVFTMLFPAGDFGVNGDAMGNSWGGNRTDIAGTLSYDDMTGAGEYTVNPFLFAGGGQMAFESGTMQAIGDGFGNPGDLISAHNWYNWNGNYGLSIDIIYDATGFFNALAFGMTVGDVISGDQLLDLNSNVLVSSLGSLLPASDAVLAGPTPLPIGPTPIAATTWNVSGTGISAQLPLIADTIGGSTQLSGPFAGLSINLDIGDLGSLHLVSVTPSAIPLPGTLWLFLSGMGLISVRLKLGRSKT